MRRAAVLSFAAFTALFALPAACGGSVGTGGAGAAAGTGGTTSDGDVDGGDVPPGASCDLLGQDCAGPDGKCSLVRAVGGGGGVLLLPVCVDDGGPLGEGEPCELTNPGFGMWAVPDAVGHDDCKTGYYCAIAGVWGDAIRKTGRCRAFCNAATQCPVNEICQSDLYCDWPPDAAAGAASAPGPGAP